MKKIFKIGLIFVIILFTYFYASHAETTNLYNEIENEATSNTATNEMENSTTNSATDEEALADDDFNFNDADTQNTSSNTSTTSNTASTSTPNYGSQINNVSAIPEANLGLNNILCIILIAIGILLILLAVAILLRLKQ